MTGKECFLNALLHKPTDRIAQDYEDTLCYGSNELQLEFENGPLGGGYDGFGLLWAAPESGGGQPVPAPGQCLLEDITQWREVVKFPEPEKYHWKEDADRLLAGFDREKNLVRYEEMNGVFDRLEMLMGFENALIALLEEPEAVNEFFEALIDYKIKALHCAFEYFKPDVVTFYDDVAAQKSPFMSPDTYRELIAPHHKRYVDEVKRLGALPTLHCCGYAEPLIESFIEEGFVEWTSVQPCNDIEALLEKYGDQICLGGGYATNDTPAATMDREIIHQEVVRCCESYGKHPSYIFFGYGLIPMTECQSIEEVWAPTGIVVEEFMNYALEHSSRIRAGKK